MTLRFQRPLVCKGLATLVSIALTGFRLSSSELDNNTQPPPELRRLEFLVGTWDTVAFYRPAPDASKFEVRGTSTVQWSANKQFLLSDERGLMPSGWENKLVVISWDSKNIEYRLIDLSPNLEPVTLSMRVEGRVRRILGYLSIGGKLIREEIAIASISEDEYSFRSELLDGEKSWVYCEGVSKKRKQEKDQ